MQYFTVKNWERFQHYKERNPPWIKLHYEIMTSQDWVMLADASKLLAVVCMMIASRNEGRVPNNPDYIKRVAYLDALPKLKPLIDCGFLVKSASTCKHMQADARPETETETETDKKDISKDISKKETKASRLDDEWYLPQDWGEWAQSESKWNPERIVREGEKFADYWKAAAGATARKRDWYAAWRNWIRKAMDYETKIQRS